MEFHHLAAELTADGTAAARDQHDFVMQVLGNLGVVQLNFVAGEEVCRVQFAETCGHRVAVLVHGLGVTDHPHAAVGGIAQIDDFAQTVAFHGGDGDDDFHNVVLAHQLGNIGNRTPHRHTLHAQVFFGQVVVHYADRVAEALVLVLAQVDSPGTGVARTDDEQWRVVLRLGSFGRLHGAYQPPEKANARDGRRVEHCTENQHRAGNRAVMVNQIKQHDQPCCQPG